MKHFFVQDLTVSHIQTKKELVEIDALVEEGMADYGDERASVLRLNMAIVEERTCQWSLFQRALRDLVTPLFNCFGVIHNIKRNLQINSIVIKMGTNLGTGSLKNICMFLFLF